MRDGRENDSFLSVFRMACFQICSDENLSITPQHSEKNQSDQSNIKKNATIIRFQNTLKTYLRKAVDDSAQRRDVEELHWGV